MDLEAGLERIFRLGEPQLGLAAAEQLGEELLEVAAHLLEGGEETLAALAVQALDALAQAADGGNEVVALGRHTGDLLLEFVGLFLGAQVDRTHRLALVHEALELVLGLLHFGQLFERLDLGQRQHALGLAVQALDDALDHGLAILGGLLDQALAAHAALARAAQFALGLAHRLVGFAELGLADREPVGRFLAIVLGLGDFLAQRHLLGLDLAGLGGKFGDGARDLFAAGVELDDLAVGVAEAHAPAGMVLRDLAQALDPHLGLAGKTLAIAFGFHQRGPQFGDARPQRARRHAVGLGVGDRRQARLAEGTAHLAVGDIGQDLGHRLLDTGQARTQLVGAAGDVGVMLARLGRIGLRGSDRTLHGALGGTRRFTRTLGLGARRLGHGALVRPGLLDAGLFSVARGGERDGLGIGAGLILRVFGGDAVDLRADLRETIALAEAYGGRRRRTGAHRVAVPAPHRALGGHELLAGPEARLQGGARRVVSHDTDEGEATRQLRQRLHMRR